MTNLNINQHLNALLLLFIFLNACNGQEKPNPTITDLPPQQSAQLDSAVQISEYVVDVFEDSKGNLWMGTMSDGVARYAPSDMLLTGKNALTYFSTKDGLCDNTVASIAEDHEGNIWLGTHNGASKYNPSAALRSGGKSFTNFGRLEGLHGEGCKILVDKNGTVWAGTNHGAFRYNGIGFSEFTIPNPAIENPSRKWEAGKVWGLIEDKKGNIWFARDAYGACKYDGTSFTHFTKKEGLCSNNISEIVEDNQGNIWFACLSSDLPKEIKEGGVCRYDGKTFTQFPEKEGLSKNDIYSIYVDKAGHIWMGATGLGVYQYDGKSFQFYKGTDRMDLTWSVGIQSILEDSKGTLWFGFSGGLFRFNGTAITNVTKTGPWD